MAKMQSHDLWGQFVRRWTLLTTMNAKTEGYVELQLKVGLPYVRKQLYCQVDVAVAAGNPWKHLLDHRFANVKDFKQGQPYLGKVMMLQSDGDVPDIWEGWEAPAKLVQQLVEGNNFEQVCAELCRAQSRPLPASVVSSFTSSARYENPAWPRVVVKLSLTSFWLRALLLCTVTRSLLPFVQEDSPYKMMRKTAASEKLRTLKDLALAKHLWIQDDGVCMHSHV